MSALQLIVTAAGKAAIVNAENTGTDPVLISQIGLTDQVFTATAATAALPGELKRLSTFAGAAVADDTIHVTIRDDSADGYTLRGFGLYTAAGVLFAVYSHAGETPDYIMQKASAAMLLLAADVRFTDIDATSITFGDADWINPPGTETVPGVLELATDAETITGTDNTRAVHAKGLKALLDSRFGAGAPSAFVKGLLSLATAALIRTALELKGAALKDEGANNGLDADLLDGQHGAYYLSWANLTGKPATFAPSAHTHTWANITDPPATATRWPAWTEVTDKPATFAPSAHTHAAADINAGTFADARIAQSNVTQHQGALSIAWTQVTGKPATFAPSAHTHDASDINAGTLAVARIPALPTSQITGLDTALAGKMSKAGDSATGTIISGTTSGESRVGGQAAGQVSAVFKYDGTMASATGGVAGTFYQIWHAGNFNPATIVYDSDTAEANTASKIPIRSAAGDITTRLFRSEYTATNASVNYIMTQVSLGAGADNYLRPSTPAQVKAALAITIADVASLQTTLNGKITSGTDCTVRDITASRGDGTGVIFLGSGTRYLYYNGSTYQLNGAGLTVGGTVTAPAFAQSSSRRYKRAIESIDPAAALEHLAGVSQGSYRMRADGSAAMGVIAEELADGPLDFAVNRTDNGEPDSVNYQPLFILACSALQGLADRVAQLERKG